MSLFDVPKKEKNTSIVKNESAISVPKLKEVKEYSHVIPSAAFQHELRQMAKDELESLELMSNEFEITDDITFEQTTDMILQSTKIKNVVENARKTHVRPFVDAQRDINSHAKEYTTPCENIKAGLSVKRKEYQEKLRKIEMEKQREEDRKRLEAERKYEEEQRAHQKAIEERDRVVREAQEKEAAAVKANKPLKQIVILPHLPEPPQTPKPVETFSKPVVPKPLEKRTDGSVRQKKVTKFEVVNFEEIPSKFLKLDEAQVKASIAAGVDSIPGLRIYDELQEVFLARR